MPLAMMPKSRLPWRTLKRRPANAHNASGNRTQNASNHTGKAKTTTGDGCHASHAASRANISVEKPRLKPSSRVSETRALNGR